jgi:hypothetical protein
MDVTFEQIDIQRELNRSLIEIAFNHVKRYSNNDIAATYQLIVLSNGTIWEVKLFNKSCELTRNN